MTEELFHYQVISPTALYQLISIVYLNKLSENSMIYLTPPRTPLGARVRQLKIH